MGDYLKTVVFIDGENLYYNLKSFEFRQEYEKPFHLLPQYVNWTKFFDALLLKINEGSNIRHVLQRIYWYVIDKVSPYREPKPWKLRRAVEKCKELGGIDTLTEEEVKCLGKKWYDDLKEAIARKREEYHSVLQTYTDFLQFRYLGKTSGSIMKCNTLESERVYAIGNSSPFGLRLYAQKIPTFEFKGA